jgi:hypothetical protein
LINSSLKGTESILIIIENLLTFIMKNENNKNLFDFINNSVKKVSDWNLFLKFWDKHQKNVKHIFYEEIIVDRIE